ncbi:hypothetical protein SAMN05421799_104245 [Alicyclobacillus vulcanalis]|uniref:Uncharacterized protein n=1 Tax=Alicyclobacillus vulcanalis TaxID=252246 RepID=A0A1N7M5X0_9BACL|nr:hypothetical protein SAMN05421799_104245 [Alicyclobacillus vulcanalis]
MVRMAKGAKAGVMLVRRWMMFNVARPSRASAV